MGPRPSDYALIISKIASFFIFFSKESDIKCKLKLNAVPTSFDSIPYPNLILKLKENFQIEALQNQLAPQRRRRKNRIIKEHLIDY